MRGSKKDFKRLLVAYCELHKPHLLEDVSDNAIEGDGVSLPFRFNFDGNISVVCVNENTISVESYNQIVIAKYTEGQFILTERKFFHE